MHRDRIVSNLLLGVGLLVSAIVVLTIAFLFKESLPALREIGLAEFFAGDGWHPTSGSFNLLPMLVATLATTVGAITLAGPCAVIVSIFMVFYSPHWLARWYEHMITLLAGIPSVVYGFWGLTTLSPTIARIKPPGQSLLTGIIILAIMILPTVVLLSTAALRSLPRSPQDAAASLALPRGLTIARIVLPQAAPGLGVAIVLATARAIGETMAVLMVCGNIVQLPGSLFDPVRTLTANIALELGYATESHRAALFVSGLMLMALVMLLVAIGVLANHCRGVRHA